MDNNVAAAAAESDDFDFFAELNGVEGGQRVTGYKPKFSDPIEAARFNFAEMGTRQIDEIIAGTGKVNAKTGMRHGNWYEEQTDGRYKITFRNGISLMRLKPDRDFFFQKDKDAAARMIAQAVAGAKKGQLDALFKATQRKDKKAAATVSAGAQMIESVTKANGAAAPAAPPAA